MKEYKETLLMPKTDFPMRGNLGVNEIPIQKKWEEEKIYEKVLKKNEGKHLSSCKNCVNLWENTKKSGEF